MRTGAAACLIAAALGASAQAQVDVTTYHYDNLRTGWNPNETTLTPKGLSSFGLLQSVTLDDQVDAQPLLVSNETINGGQHDVVYVATESNSVYAIDAQSGQVLLQTNLGAPVPYTDLPALCGNNGPNVGINSTPVIDTSTGALYVIDFTLQNNKLTYYLHALSLTTLADIIAPVEVTATGTLSDGKLHQFNAGVSRQRAALLLANGNIYAGFASFCDVSANLSRGWVLGWQESNLAPLASNKLVDTRSKAPNHFFLSSVWMSGYGLAANSSGSVFFLTGNSDPSGTTYDKVTNISESAAEVSPDLTTLQGLFTPGNHRFLDKWDNDFGGGGIMLMPPQPGNYPDLALAGGKYGNYYLLDADNLATSFGTYPIGECFCGSSYFQGSDGVGRVVTSAASTVGVYAIDTTSKPKLVLKAQSPDILNGQNPGFFTSVSSNGSNAGTAVVWAVGRPVNKDPAYVHLYAISPESGQVLFSAQAGQWLNTGGNANIVPVVANGLVYVASDQMLTIFGAGGKHKAGLLKIRRVAMQAPLARGEHEIYGIAVSVKGAAIVMRRRSGETLDVDASSAIHTFRFAEPEAGKGLIVRGSFDRGRVLQADTVLHATNDSAMWPPDR